MTADIAFPLLFVSPLESGLYGTYNSGRWRKVPCKVPCGMLWSLSWTVYVIIGLEGAVY